MRVLLTNDDGLAAPGLAALHAALLGLDRIDTLDVVAPAKVQSATSHAVTFHRPIRVAPGRLHSLSPDATGQAVDGRPADCVKLALAGVLSDDAPVYDVVISGMNAGANVGINVLYSGTVGAAREATFEGLPAIAVSLHLKDWQVPDEQWRRAAGHAASTIDRLIDHPIASGTLLNLNVPVLDGGAEPRGVRLCPIATNPMVAGYDRGTDDDGATTYTAKSGMNFGTFAPGTDVSLLFEKYLTVTPLHYDLTCTDSLAAWSGSLPSAPSLPGGAGSRA